MQVNPKQVEEDVGEFKEQRKQIRQHLHRWGDVYDYTYIVQSDFIIDNEEISENLNDALETAMRVINRLFTKIKLSGQIEQIEIEYYSGAYNRVQQCVYGCTKASTTT